MELLGNEAYWESLAIKFLKPVILNEPYTTIALVTSKNQWRACFDTWVEDVAGTIAVESSSVRVPATERGSSQTLV